MTGTHAHAKTWRLLLRGWNLMFRLNKWVVFKSQFLKLSEHWFLIGRRLSTMMSWFWSVFSRVVFLFFIEKIWWRQHAEALLVGCLLNAFCELIGHDLLPKHIDMFLYSIDKWLCLVLVSVVSAHVIDELFVLLVAGSPSQQIALVVDRRTTVKMDVLRFVLAQAHERNYYYITNETIFIYLGAD